MSAELVYIPENSYGYVNKKLVRAVFAGNLPYRCRRCVFNRCKIDKCYRVACEAQEREDGKNVYFETYKNEREHSYKA